MTFGSSLARSHKAAASNESEILAGRSPGKNLVLSSIRARGPR